jgi:non-ribosomal peptide synthetase component E (peptide arylation enzyme)
VRIVDAVPLTPVGKVDRKAMRTLLAVEATQAATP